MTLSAINLFFLIQFWPKTVIFCAHVLSVQTKNWQSFICFHRIFVPPVKYPRKFDSPCNVPTQAWPAQSHLLPQIMPSPPKKLWPILRHGSWQLFELGFGLECGYLSLTGAGQTVGRWEGHAGISIFERGKGQISGFKKFQWDKLRITTKVVN